MSLMIVLTFSCQLERLRKGVLTAILSHDGARERFKGSPFRPGGEHAHVSFMLRCWECTRLCQFGAKADPCFHHL